MVRTRLQPRELHRWIHSPIRVSSAPGIASLWMNPNPLPVSADAWGRPVFTVYAEFI